MSINAYLTFGIYKRKPHHADGAKIFKRWLQPESLIKMILPGQDHGFSPGRLTGKVEKDFFCKCATKINKFKLSGLYKHKKIDNQNATNCSNLIHGYARNSPTK